MSAKSQQFDFLHEYIEEALRQAGYGNLDEKTKQEFFPRFVAQAEVRLGSAIMPLINEDAAKELESKIKNNADPEEWLKFWQKNVPNFQDVVAKTLKDFVEEIKQLADGLK